MKHAIALGFIAAMMALSLAGCAQDYSSNGTTVSFWTDKATGCSYVVQSQGGIYPRRGMVDEPEICKEK